MLHSKQILAFAVLLLLPSEQTNALLSTPPPLRTSTKSTGLRFYSRPSTTSLSSPLEFRHNAIFVPSHHKLSLSQPTNPLTYQQHDTSTTQLFQSANDEDGSDEVSSSSSSPSQPPLSVVMGVGAITAFIGYLYSICMKKGFKLLWNTIPNAIFDFTKSSTSSTISTTTTGGLLGLLHQYPAAYIVLLMTLGGGLVATLSTLYFPKLFNAHDYVHILSDTNGEDGASTTMDQFPKKTRDHLLPVMVLSLIMSISGFSLGPEAPMVTAGGLAGVSLARKYLQSSKEQSGDGSSDSNAKSVQETLAYAGAAGTLTGFMNIPLAGPIFAMEMTSRGTGMNSFAANSWNAAMAACFSGFVFVRGCLVPNSGVGGHFLHGSKAAVGALKGGEMVLASLGCGVAGAAVGTIFHKTISFLKSVIWSGGGAKSSSSSDKKEKYTKIAKKTSIAMIIGLLSVLYPQTMFWGEGSLQCMLDGQCTPLSATHHGIPSLMTQFARVNPDLPFPSGMAALQVGLAKFLAITLASAGGFPGGVIFPTLSNGASLSQALVSAVKQMVPLASSSLVPPLMVMSFMAALLTSITRTPLATVLILALSSNGMTPLSVLLPGVMMASYVSVWISDRLSSDSFFHYAE